MTTLRYLSHIETVIRDHAELARLSSNAGRMQAAVDADPCAQGTCGHNPFTEHGPSLLPTPDRERFLADYNHESERLNTRSAAGNR